MPSMPLTKTEIEICKFIVLRFLEHGEATPRPALLREFRGDLRTPLDKLVQRSVVIQTGMVDNKEFYVPTAVAFDYCGDSEALAVAKKSADSVLSALLSLYEEDVEDDSLDRVHSQTDVMDHLPLGVDERTVRLGLYFAKGFGFVGPQQMDANYIFFESFRIHERIYEVMETDSPWDSHVERTRKIVENYPRSVSLESYDEPEQPRNFRELKNKEQAISDAGALIGRQAGIAFLVFDLDNFKKANDTMGHEKGDDCLQSILDIFLANLGKRGTVYRWGQGDEFIVLLPDFSSEEAFATAERIRRAVENARLGVSDSPITLSVGVSGSDLLTKGSVSDLLVGADQAMTQVSKKQGKNCVRIWTPA
jgi:diguanylate cyclase (GGDEF)-like protein